jgi:hypothetical protein
MLHLARRLLLLLVVMLTAGVVVGCAGLGDRIVLSERELQGLLDKRFPQDRRAMEVFDVRISAPRVTLLPERNRLASTLDIAARDRLLGTRWGGELRFDSELRWDAAAQAVQLVQVRVQDLAVQGNVGTDRNPAERLGAALAERMLEGMAIYTLSPERAAELQKRGVAPAAVNVTSRGVEVTFEPVKR